MNGNLTLTVSNGDLFLVKCKGEEKMKKIRNVN